MKKVLSFLVVLALALSLCPAVLAADTGYTDIPADADCAEAVVWCREHQLMNGVEDGSRFDPEGTLDRRTLATILHRASGEPPLAGDPLYFADIETGTWYTRGALWAASEGIMGGYGNGLFGSTDAVSQEMMQVILDRYLGKGDTWVGNPDLAGPATRAEIAVALMAALKDKLDTPTTPAPETTPEPEKSGRILVAVFSCTNNTRGVADKIVKSLDSADLYEITPAQPYTSADLNYNTDCRANREQNDDSARPAISGSVGNMDNYDVIFLGYPIWWGKSPKIIYTFLESYDFAGKTVIPFCTSASSLYSDSGIKSLVGNDTTWVTGSRFSGSASESTVKAWVDSLNLGN